MSRPGSQEVMGREGAQRKQDGLCGWEMCYLEQISKSTKTKGVKFLTSREDMYKDTKGEE